MVKLPSKIYSNELNILFPICSICLDLDIMYYIYILPDHILLLHILYILYHIETRYHARYFKLFGLFDYANCIRLASFFSFGF